MNASDVKFNKKTRKIDNAVILYTTSKKSLGKNGVIHYVVVKHPIFDGNFAVCLQSSRGVFLEVGAPTIENAKLISDMYISSIIKATKKV